MNEKREKQSFLIYKDKKLLKLRDELKKKKYTELKKVLLNLY